MRSACSEPDHLCLDALVARRESGPAGPARMVVASLPPSIRQNPYQRLLYGSLATHGIALHADRVELTVQWLWRMRRHVHALHFHWPQTYYRAQRTGWLLSAAASWVKLGLFALRLRAAHLLGYRIVWTVHQVLPHERSGAFLDALGARTLSRASDALIAHDQATAASAFGMLRCNPQGIHVIPHGSYVGFYPPGRARDRVRAELGIPGNAFVFLAFGNVRAYKDLDVLLQAFGDGRLPEVALVVAGAPINEQVAEDVLRHARHDPRIKACLGFVPDERVAELFGAADVAVVPRRDGGTSGALVLAMSMGLPVIAVDAPSYRDLLDDGLAGWFFRPSDAASLQAALECAAAYPPVARLKGEAALARAQQLDWTGIAGRTAEVLAGPNGARGQSVSARITSRPNLLLRSDVEDV